MSAEALSVRVSLGWAGFDLDVDETLPLEGVTALFGPSGSGKSTLLRVLAGFERPRDGRVSFGSQTWLDTRGGVFVPPHRRPVGYLFQDARLFPHLNVLGNLRFAEQRRADDAGYTFDDVVAAIELGGLLERRVDGLSGGERQRVALARTLLAHPRLLLLDEPLAAIDHARKAELLPYLEGLPGRFGIPTVYVSHDIDEVARLADRIIVLESGRVRQHGPAAAVFQELDLEPLSGRFEAGAVFEGQVVARDERLRLCEVAIPGATLSVPLQGRAATSQTVRLRIRARDVALATRHPEGISIRNVLGGVIGELEAVPGTAFVEVRVLLSGGPAGHPGIPARITRAAAEELALAAGMPVYVLVKSVSFDA